MSEEGKSVWRATEEAVGLPECPSDMSSPKLASFLYDQLCMVRLSYTVMSRRLKYQPGMPREEGSGLSLSVPNARM